MSFAIPHSEKNARKGAEYETKSLIYSFEKMESEEVSVDLFEDITNFKSNNEYNFIQAKNVETFTVSKLNTALKTLVFNYENQDNKKKKIKYILFLKNFTSKKDFENFGKTIIENELYNLNELSEETKKKIITKHQIDVKFFENTYIYMCKKENYKYIDLNEEKFKDKFREEIFDEIADKIMIMKSKEVDSKKKLTFEEWKEKYPEKNFSKKDYKNFLYKRVVGMNLIEELDTTYKDGENAKKYIHENEWENFQKYCNGNEDKIKIQLYKLYCSNPEFLNKIIDLVIESKDNEEKEKNLINEAIKIKKESIIDELDDNVIKLLIIKMTRDKIMNNWRKNGN